MIRTGIAGAAFLLVQALLVDAGRAESLPSFNAWRAARVSTDIAVVEEGKVVDVWKGTMKVGDKWPTPADLKPVDIEYIWIGADVDLLKKEIEARGLKFVTRATGKRLVRFQVRDGAPLPADPKLAEDLESARRGFNNDPTDSIVWIESGQAFAVQQFHNPGPSTLLPLSEMSWNRKAGQMENLALTEDQFKKAVADLIEISREYDAARVEKDVPRREALYMKMLRPENHRRTMFVWPLIYNERRDVWPPMQPVLQDPKQIGIHAEAIWLLYGRTDKKDRDAIVAALEKILAAKLPPETKPEDQEHDRRRKIQAKNMLEHWRWRDEEEKKLKKPAAPAAGEVS